MLALKQAVLAAGQAVIPALPMYLCLVAEFSGV